MPPLVKSRLRPEPMRVRRSERLAVNIPDLTRLPPEVIAVAFQGRLSKDPIRMDHDRGDEMAVEMVGCLLDAACLLDHVRWTDRKAGRSPTRVYLKKQTWQKLPGNADMTRVNRADDPPIVELDPEWFPGADVRRADMTPIPARRLF